MPGVPSRPGSYSDYSVVSANVRAVTNPSQVFQQQLHEYVCWWAPACHSFRCSGKAASENVL